MSLILVIGGIRSGKSRFAEQLALSEGAFPWVYLPTAYPSDPEMIGRIERHRRERDARWEVMGLPDAPEPPDALLRRLGCVPSGATFLLDGMGLLLGQFFMFREKVSSARVLEDADPLCAWLSDRNGLTVVVTDEAGSGGIPMTVSGRSFADVLGEMNQKLAKKARSVYLMVAGYPLTVKS
ncbi:MAG: bifunctional adenosylcobinamide kinase/adenosylcobinamide-phosphate guanylyltransferase [Nitrospirae bacterium]|nr:bifunctional adenosylcobinamide kinase/adenosylcobinamide-phosphate guanylyltransferase [Nitrospirota bacterium]